MALQTTRLQGLRQRDDRREAVADQNVANAFQPQARASRPRGEMQRSTFEAQVATPRMQFTEQAQFNERKAGIERQKAAELRDIANQALAEKNSEFARSQALRRNKIEDERLGMDREKHALDQEATKSRLQLLREGGTGRSASGRGTAAETDPRWGGGSAELDIPETDEAADTPAEAAKPEPRLWSEKMDVALAERERLNGIRVKSDGQQFGPWAEKMSGKSSSTTISPLGKDAPSTKPAPGSAETQPAARAAAATGVRSPSNRKPFTEGRETYITAILRKEGYDTSPLVVDGEPTYLFDELMGAMDGIAEEKPNASRAEIFKEAVDLVGLKTTIQAKQADIDERMKSPDGKIAKQARAENKTLLALDAQRKKDATMQETEAAAAPLKPEERKAVFGGIQKGLSSKDHKDYGASFKAAKRLFDNDDLGTEELADIHRSMEKAGRVDAAKAKTAEGSAILKALDIKQEWLGRGEDADTAGRPYLLKRIKTTFNVDDKKAAEILERTQDNILRARAMADEFKRYDAESEVDSKVKAQQDKLREIAKKSGFSL
jgi:hypothetical protein